MSASAAASGAAAATSASAAETATRTPCEELNALPALRAVFDFEPEAPEELAFSEGDVLLLVDDSNSDWFDCVNTRTGLRGFAPSNRLASIESDEPVVPSLSESMFLSEKAEQVDQAPLNAKVFATVMSVFKAIGEGQMDVDVGDIVEVLDLGEKDWIFAKLVSRQTPVFGWIPYSFVKMEAFSTERARTFIEVKDAEERVSPTSTERSINSFSVNNLKLNEVSKENREKVKDAWRSSMTSVVHASFRSASVVACEKRPDLRYWYTLEVCDAKRVDIIFRTYEHFYDFHLSLLTAFYTEAGTTRAGETSSQPRIIPYLPGQKLFVTEAVAKQRRADLDFYMKQLLELPSYMTRSVIVTQFLTPTEEDVETIKSLGREISCASASGTASAPVSPLFVVDSVTVGPHDQTAMRSSKRPAGNSISPQEVRSTTSSTAPLKSPSAAGTWKNGLGFGSKSQSLTSFLSLKPTSSSTSVSATSSSTATTKTAKISGANASTSSSMKVAPNPSLSSSTDLPTSIRRSGVVIAGLPPPPQKVPMGARPPPPSKGNQKGKDASSGKAQQSDKLGTRRNSSGSGASSLKERAAMQGQTLKIKTDRNADGLSSGRTAGLSQSKVDGGDRMQATIVVTDTSVVSATADERGGDGRARSHTTDGSTLRRKADAITTLQSPALSVSSSSMPSAGVHSAAARLDSSAILMAEKKNYSAFPSAGTAGTVSDASMNSTAGLLSGGRNQSTSSLTVSTAGSLSQLSSPITPRTMAGESESFTTIKVSVKDRIVLIKMSIDFGYEELVRKVSQKLGKDFQDKDLTFQDADGDQITIKDDDDLSFAREMAAAKGRILLRVT